MKRTYLLLAVVGAILPYIFFFQFVQIEGFSLLTFVEAFS